MVFNILIFAVAILVWIKYRRPPKDDPRLSRGLQILQSKISILEDLSDKTDVQVRQLNSLLDQKGCELRRKLDEANDQIRRVEISIQKSKEVATLFEDKIPHRDIIDRQNAKKYAQAALMAHEGYSTQEIAKQVDLSLGELDFIVKINKNQLMYANELLASVNQLQSQNPPQTQTQNRDQTSAQTTEKKEEPSSPKDPQDFSRQVPANPTLSHQSQTSPTIRPVAFPQIGVSKKSVV